MSYDLLACPVDRAMKPEEAIAEITARARKFPLSVGRDRRIKAFAAALDDAYPGIGSMRSPIPMELEIHRDWVFMALPWSMVTDLVRSIGPIAFEAGLALYDPQREEVALPAPFGTAPLATAGVAAHEQMAATAMNAIVGGLDVPSGMTVDAGINESLHAAGFVMRSPLGFDITPEIEAEALANPTRVPTSLQTPERKAQLIGQLREDNASRRYEALHMLGGWDADAEVATALRDLLASDDATTVSFATHALARQRDPAGLAAMLEAVHRMSPADGGSTEAMLMPLAAAFELARLVGPEAVADLTAKAREWHEPPPGSRRQRGLSDASFEQMLKVMATGDEFGPPA